MQYVVNVLFAGHYGPQSIDMRLWMLNKETGKAEWMPIHVVTAPPYSTRVLQVFRGEKGWLALIETSAEPPS